MIDLLNSYVSHKKHGKGKITDQSNTHIYVKFSNHEAKFQYPEAFEKFLICDDPITQKDLLEEIKEKSKSSCHNIDYLNKPYSTTNNKKINSEKAKPPKYPKENIAFKCNYCDGGVSKNGIGYLCACSNEMINYNIEVAHHNWCCDATSKCKQYHDNLITRKQLDNFSKNGDFVCYESQMLSNWAAFAGYILRGENREKPLKLNKVQINSLAILTTREKYLPEKDRIIFGVFLIDEAYEGDNYDAGYVTTTSKYKISLSLIEARNILFWNYYHNENAPHKTAWGQGLHRYITDEQAANILKDIWQIKKGTSEEALAKEFFEYFCEINSIDTSHVPSAKGALKR